MKISKRLLALALALLLILPLFAACGSSSNDEANVDKQNDIGKKDERSDWKSTFEGFMNAVMGKGGDAIDYFHPTALDYYINEVKADLPGWSDEEIKQALNTTFSDYQISEYEITNNRFYDTDSISNRELLAECPGFESGCEIEFSCKSPKYDSGTVELIKCNGKWYVLSLSFTGGLTTFIDGQM